MTSRDFLHGPLRHVAQKARPDESPLSRFSDSLRRNAHSFGEQLACSSTESTIMHSTSLREHNRSRWSF